MRSRQTWMCLASTVLLLMAVTGCQSAGGGAPAAAKPTKAVVITTGQGSTTVYVPTADNTGVTKLSTADASTCPQCEADALAYFKTGQLSSKCPVCGASRTPAHAIN